MAVDTARTLTRRGALQVAGAAGLVLVCGRSIPALIRALGSSGSATSGSGALARLAADGPAAAWRRTSYAPLVGQVFSVRGTSARMRLGVVTDLSHAPAGSDNAFGLMFSLEHGSIDANRLPRLHHAAIGSFPLFVTAVAAVKGTPQFLAVINRSHA